MTSQKQLEANRRNAQKSTGPQTPAGKAQSARNSLKHGLTAKDTVVLQNEPIEAFQAFYEGLMVQLAPETALECILAERVAAAAWRLNRAGRIEKEIMFHLQHLDRHHTQIDPELPDWKSRYATEPVLGPNIMGKLNKFQQLNRYESHLEKIFYMALHELERQQERRRQAEPSAPIDVELSPDDDGIADAD